ncbi:DExH-box splicing factor binding site-domain-containing protein [Hypoxylon sp. FL0543]|nr:DExH-box splicing factor binding site-domain-containing protein [Hypoxylon sp. FL0543]
MSERAPRIAIKFGASSSSKSSNGAKKPTHPLPPSTLGKRHRPHALNDDSDSGSDEERFGRHEAVTTLGGDLSDSEAKRRSVNKDKSKRSNAPYVITGHTNRDWKAEIKARKATREAGPSSAAERDPADQDKHIKWGLTVTKKTAPGDGDASNDNSFKDEKPTAVDSDNSPRGDDPKSSKNGDTDAMDALLGKKRKSAKDLVIEGTPKRDTAKTPSEEDVYRRRIEEAAEVSTIDEYDQIPEGEFGAAMLRGMGWNGEERGSKPKEVKRRPNLMGLGSKEDEEIKKAELARKHGYRERRPRLDEYRREKDREKRDRDERHAGSYKSERERERERRDHSHSRNYGERDRNSHRHDDRSHRR